jgi:hypothetical protein
MDQQTMTLQMRLRVTIMLSQPWRRNLCSRNFLPMLDHFEEFVFPLLYVACSRFQRLTQSSACQPFSQCDPKGFAVAVLIDELVVIDEVM